MRARVQVGKRYLIQHAILQNSGSVPWVDVEEPQVGYNLNILILKN